ncbi:unnamed protein product [Blepharisma stoltei]|uniref:Uncharacterized protein n=1 Tax=Blepharisma stoltei TaxID=1481888 RepID=A0AAU9K485_9CILI|nr:unnamed protein product [Blepharisma stoltei]
MEYTTVEVKFSQSDLKEDSKKLALDNYAENNYRLGLIFSDPKPEDPEPTTLQEGLLNTPEFSVKLDDLQHMTSTFSESINSIRSGNLEHGLKLAESYGLVDMESPDITFLKNRESIRRNKIAQTPNILPWTSGDSITIFPL